MVLATGIGTCLRLDSPTGHEALGLSVRRRRGRAVRDRRQLERIDALRIPPAWRDVHIAPSPRSAIQAWGFDARGRQQYRYNERAVERRELRKYHRVRQLAKELPRVRRTMHDDARPSARADTLDADAVAATVLRLISETFCRVGGERYAKENGTFGITTLRKSHVELCDGTRIFEYTRQGQHQAAAGRARPRARAARGAPAPHAGHAALSIQARRRWRVITRARRERVSADVASGATARRIFARGAERCAPRRCSPSSGRRRAPTEAKRNVALAMRLVSSELGNTPTICRKSYVHPMVVARYLDEGETIPLPRARGGAANRGQAHSPEERALIAFLDGHFPERRKEPRRTSPAQRRTFRGNDPSDIGLRSRG